MSEGSSLIFHVVGDGVSDCFVGQVEENSEILLHCFDDIFNVLVKSENKFKIDFVICAYGFENVPSPLPILLI